MRSDYIQAQKQDLQDADVWASNHKHNKCPDNLFKINLSVETGSEQSSQNISCRRRHQSHTNMSLKNLNFP